MKKIMVSVVIFLSIIGYGEQKEVSAKEEWIGAESLVKEIAVPKKKAFVPKSNELSEEQMGKFIKVQKKLIGSGKSLKHAGAIEMEQACKEVGVGSEEFIWIFGQIMRTIIKIKMGGLSIGGIGEDVPEKNIELIKKHEKTLSEFSEFLE
ncbi:MAG: hypothetical protein QMD94_03455 [Candidatus Omnitrophota bacterium]|nr:hypothetical protein [Candidatus Omnitrophota bacterium]